MPLWPDRYDMHVGFVRKGDLKASCKENRLARISRFFYPVHFLVRKVWPTSVAG